MPTGSSSTSTASGATSTPLTRRPSNQPMAVTARKREEPRAQGGIGQFLRDVYDELRKVVWPTAGELYRYTLVVIFTVILLGIFIGGTDYILAEVARRTLYNNGVH